MTDVAKFDTSVLMLVTEELYVVPLPQWARDRRWIWLKIENTTHTLFRPHVKGLPGLQISG